MRKMTRKTIPRKIEFQRSFAGVSVRSLYTFASKFSEQADDLITIVMSPELSIVDSSVIMLWKSILSEISQFLSEPIVVFEMVRSIILEVVSIYSLAIASKKMKAKGSSKYSPSIIKSWAWLRADEGSGSSYQISLFLVLRPSLKLNMILPPWFLKVL